MKTAESVQTGWIAERLHSYRGRSISGLIATSALAALATLCLFHFSLIATSAPISATNMQTITRAIDILEEKGFHREAFLLKHTATFRSSDHWLNRVILSENAYAATNFPVQIITVYPDFYTKTIDDTERAMVLLHEAQHLQRANEAEAYAYVWRNRGRLGWTQLPYGTTASYITVEELTRENAPELFTCTSKVWNDCTETLQARR